jgi:glycine/D-amino acid oxidase-like deaminating enzyme
VRVTVLGAGITGLTTAVSLLDAGCEVHVVTASPIEASTSYLAAAVWFPTHVGPPGRVAAWGLLGDLSAYPVRGQAIIARCTQIVPDMAGASVIEHIVGLRPGRPVVRLEESPSGTPGTRAIHNYGHGGAGITLSWGCADDVTRILLRRSD